MKTISSSSTIRQFRCRDPLGRAAVVTAAVAWAFSAITAMAAPQWSPPVTLSKPAANAQSPEIAAPIAGRLEQYGTSSTGVALRWTAFEPASEGQHPAVLVLHAGGFKTGDAGPLDVAQDLADAGFFALATEYRLAPPHTPMNAPEHPPPSQDSVFPIDDGHYPEQTTDVQMAIRAARQDPRCNGLVYLVGGSAGASHSVYMAARGTPGDDMPDLIVCLSGPYDFADLGHLETPCVPDETCFWDAVINYVGVPDFINYLRELAEAAPITYVTGNFPPAFILVSSNDASQLGIHDFPQLLAKFNSVGITESTARYPEAGHYKQWVVPVGPNVRHAFEYWDEAKSLVIAWLQAGAQAQNVTFDFDNAPQYAPLPLYLTAGGITGYFSSGSPFYNYSIQRADVLGFTPAGFSGLCIYPSTVYESDLLVSFDTQLTSASILYAPEEYATDSSCTMRMTAYLGTTYVGTNTYQIPIPGTWPSGTLSFSSTSPFDNIVIHYDAPPPTGGDYGPIFMADNLVVTPGGGTPTPTPTVTPTATPTPTVRRQLCLRPQQPRLRQPRLRPQLQPRLRLRLRLQPRLRLQRRLRPQP